LSEKRKRKAGYGWHLTGIPDRSQGFILEKEPGRMRKNSGNPFRVFTVSAQSAILIFWRHMKRLYPETGTDPPERKQDRRTILKDSAAHSGRVFPGWSEKHFRFPKMTIIISVQSVILSGNSIQHYLCSTTNIFSVRRVGEATA